METNPRQNMPDLYREVTENLWWGYTQSLVTLTHSTLAVFTHTKTSQGQDKKFQATVNNLVADAINRAIDFVQT